MSDRLRAFFAVDLSDAARGCAAGASDELRAALGDAARFTPPANLHLTLKFLGEIDEAQVPRLVERAAAKLARAAAFEVGFAGFGAFPNAREARIVWLGISTGAGALAKLARQLDSAARAVGAERDRRPFAAHLTLARLRDPRRIELERLAPPTPVEFGVREVVLYESRPAVDGARYVSLARLPLGVGGDAETSTFAPYE